MKAFFQKYKHAWVLLYAFLYLPWFFWLESRANLPYHVIHVWLDDKIPFVEYFIVPYLLWFVYVAAVFLYLFFKGTKQEFYRYCAFLFTGMTLFLVISTLYPNGHLLRPTEFHGTISSPSRYRFCTRRIPRRISSRVSMYSIPSQPTGLW